MISKINVIPCSSSYERLTVRSSKDSKAQGCCFKCSDHSHSRLSSAMSLMTLLFKHSTSLGLTWTKSNDKKVLYYIETGPISSPTPFYCYIDMLMVRKMCAMNFNLHYKAVTSMYSHNNNNNNNNHNTRGIQINFYWFVSSGIHLA